MSRSEAWVAPTSVSMNVHTFDTMRARHNRGVDGSFHLECVQDGYETAAFVFFTGDKALAEKLAAAVNETIANHTASAQP